MYVGEQGGEKPESFGLCFEILFLSYLPQTEVEKKSVNSKMYVLSFTWWK